MTYQRQMLAVLAGFFLAAGWASGSSAHPASHVAQHPVAIDSTDYQSQEQLLANTQVMVVARVESVGRDRSAPASQPAVLVTLQVHDVIRGRVGEQIVVAQPRAASSATGQVEQMPLRSGRTYLLLLARELGSGPFFLVGGDAGEFAYNSTTRRFTKMDASATWEESDFALSLAKIGAETFPESIQPSWLTTPAHAGSQALSWSSMANDLGMSPTDVACPSEKLCVFAGAVSPRIPARWCRQWPSAAVPFPRTAASSGRRRPFRQARMPRGPSLRVRTRISAPCRP